MVLVRATDCSKKFNINIAELGRVAKPGEVFSVTNERFIVLTGSNKYNLKFVNRYDNTNVSINVKPTNTTTNIDKEPIVDEIEEPEIYVVEPGKEPVKVDDNLEPIVEKPKRRKRTTTKKETK